MIFIIYDIYYLLLVLCNIIYDYISIYIYIYKDVFVHDQKYCRYFYLPQSID